MNQRHQLGRLGQFGDQLWGDQSLGGHLGARCVAAALDRGCSAITWITTGEAGGRAAAVQSGRWQQQPSRSAPAASAPSASAWRWARRPPR
jgi:hypothetical protein